MREKERERERERERELHNKFKINLPLSSTDDMRSRKQIRI